MKNKYYDVKQLKDPYCTCFIKQHKKKYRLRKWVEFVLIAIMIISGMILVSDATSIKTFIIKGFICLPIFTTSSVLLSVYGDLNE